MQWAAKSQDQRASWRAAGDSRRTRVVLSTALYNLHPSTMYHGQMQRSRSELAGLGRFEEPAVLILTSLVEGPLHGYAIVKDVETVAGVRLGPGTLYATLARLEARGLISGVPSNDRRRPYRITASGLALLRDRLERMDSIAQTGLKRLARV